MARLATDTGDCGLLLTVEPTFRDWMSLHHYLSLSRLHMTIDVAFAEQVAVKQHALYFEHEVILPDADEPSAEIPRCIRPSPRIRRCSAARLRLRDGVPRARRAWYVERETGSDTPGRVAAKKCKGYAGLGQLYKRRFPHAGDFRVLAVCPNAGWRSLLMREMKRKPGAELWLFCAAQDVTAANVLHEPIFYKLQANPEAGREKEMAVRGPLPLIPRPPAYPGRGAVPV